jgi:hypothetical protein
MLDSVKRFLGRVYLIPVSVESLTHLTLSNRLTGDHLVFLLFILPPARFRLPTLLIKHTTIITSMDATPFLERRNCTLLLYIRPNFHKALYCSLCSDASTIIRQCPYYPNAFISVRGNAMQVPMRYPVGPCSLRVLTSASGRGQIPSVSKPE